MRAAVCVSSPARGNCDMAVPWLAGVAPSGGRLLFELERARRHRLGEKLMSGHRNEKGWGGGAEAD